MKTGCRSNWKIATWCGDFSPNFLEQDFSRTTPSAYLSEISPLQEAEHVVRAEQPAESIRSHLQMAKGEPCLVVVRRTWGRGRPVTYGRFFHPGSRFELSGHYLPPGETERSERAKRKGGVDMQEKRTVKAPTGSALSAKSWLTEAPLRMLMNNLDPEVAERPDDLVVYGGIGRAARNWDCFDAIVAALKALDDDETLLVAIRKTGRCIPHAYRRAARTHRQLQSRAGVGELGAFRELDRRGLMMYGQMTAGSWIYIGSQGIVQGTYETFVEMGRQHYDGDLAGRWILTAGLGGMGARSSRWPRRWPAHRCWPLSVRTTASTSVWRPAISISEPTAWTKRLP